MITRFVNNKLEIAKFAEQYKTVSNDFGNDDIVNRSVERQNEVTKAYDLISSSVSLLDMECGKIIGALQNRFNIARVSVNKSKLGYWDTLTEMHRQIKMNWNKEICETVIKG